MKKAIICGAALAGFAWLGFMPGVSQAAAQAVEAQNNYQAVTVDDFVENEDIFEIAGLRSNHITDEYRLSKYDKVTMSFLDFPGGLGQATGSTAGDNGDTVIVGPDGYAALPYVGKVKLEGLTLDEASEVIREKLSRYLRITEMYVSVKSYAPRKVYVMGAVNSPGVKDMSIDNMNAYAALATAGGVNKRGRSTKVQIIRVIDGTMYYRQLDMKAYVRKHDLTQNVVLEEGDIIYVPKSNAILWRDDILPLLSGWYMIKSLTD